MTTTPTPQAQGAGASDAAHDLIVKLGLWNKRKEVYQLLDALATTAPENLAGSSDDRKLINIALGLMDAPKGANLVTEVAKLLSAPEVGASGAPSEPTTATSTAWIPIAMADKHGDPVWLFDPELVDADFNPTGTVDGHWQDDVGWMGAVWDGYRDEWATKIVNPTHWMPRTSPHSTLNALATKATEPAPAAAVTGEPIQGESFMRAWLKLDKLPGTMMVGPEGKFGPVPATTSCLVTTSERERDIAVGRGQPMIEVWLTSPAPAQAPSSEPDGLMWSVERQQMVRRPKAKAGGEVSDAAAARLQALEEAANVCDEYAKSLDNEWNRKLGYTGHEDCAECAAAIRALALRKGAA